MNAPAPAPKPEPLRRRNGRLRIDGMAFTTDDNKHIEWELQNMLYRLGEQVWNEIMRAGAGEPVCVEFHGVDSRADPATRATYLHAEVSIERVHTFHTTREMIHYVDKPVVRSAWKRLKAWWTKPDQLILTARETERLLRK